VRVVRFHVDPGAEHGHSAIVVLCGVINQPASHFAAMVPQDLTCLRVERICIVPTGDKHDARHNNRSHLQRAHRSRMEHPLRLQVTNICRSDLRQAAEALPTIVAII